MGLSKLIPYKFEYNKSALAIISIDYDIYPLNNLTWELKGGKLIKER